MPVSYAMRKLGNVLPDVLPPDELVVDLLPPPPPHPAATNATQAVMDAAASHFPAFLRFKSYLPILHFAVGGAETTPTPSARCIVPDVQGGRLVRTGSQAGLKAEKTATARSQLGR